MASAIPLSTPVWRISPEHFVDVLKEMDERLEPKRQAAREAKLAPYRERVESANERGSAAADLEAKFLADAERRIAENESPRWFFVTRSGRQDEPEGTIDEIAPGIDVPERYRYASSRLRGGDSAIELTLDYRKISFTIRGEDEMWLRDTERWAQATLRLHRPKWWWMRTMPGYLTGIIVAIVIALVPIPLQAALGGYGLVASAVAAILAWGTSAAFIVALNRPPAIVGQIGMRRTKAFWGQTGLLFAGAVLGQLVAVLWRAVEEAMK